MSNFHARVLSILFVLVIAVPLATELAGFSPPVAENVTVAPIPTFTASNAFDSDTYSELGASLDSRFPFRRRTYMLRDSIESLVFGERSDEVVEGDNGWIFLADSLTKNCESLTPSRRAVNQLVERLELWDDDGHQVTVVIAPDKFTIETNKIDDAPGASCALEEAAALELQAEAVAGEQIVTLWEELRTEAEPTYFVADTHWNDLGAAIAIEKVFGASLEGIEFGRGDDVVWEGDLTRIEGSPRWHVAPSVSMTAPESAVSIQNDDVFNNDSIIVFEAEPSAGVDILPGTTLVVHDSFFARQRPAIARLSEKTIFAHWRVLDQIDLDELMTQADRVYLEVVQRNFWTQVRRNLRPQ